MFSRFDKRASTVTVKNDGHPGQLSNGQRQAQPAPLKLDTITPVEPPATSWNSHSSRDNLMGAASPPTDFDRPPPVPRHQASFEYRTAPSPQGVVEDEDARLLADSVLAGKFLTDGPRNDPQAGRYRHETDHFSAPPPKPISSHIEKEDNLFAGSSQRASKPSYNASTRGLSNDSGKVMTPAEFERYRLDKEREGMHKAAHPSMDNDDEDEINYEDEEDEEDKLKRQAKQRRSQQASMAAYRQKNMKTTGELRSTSPLHVARAVLPTSLSAPHLGLAKTPSPEPVRPAQDNDDEDEDIPLGILQAHGFPHKNRQSGQLTSYGSNPNLRASTYMSAGRPTSTLGEPSSGPGKRHSTLPAFARGLPQDPFVGAGIARPALRESLAMGGGSQTHLSPISQQQAPMPPGGLVGVIASEERSRAMRRGSPNMESQKLMNGGNIDPMAGIPSHMMYNGGHLGMSGGVGTQRPQQQLSVGDQAQLQMTQQMQQFMQMQMQFMQMMSANQQGGPQQQMPPHMMQQMMQQQHPGFAAPHAADFSSGQSVMGVPTNQSQPRRLDPSMRTMSMIQPATSSSYLHGPGFGAPAPLAGYTPSIAPSERSNIGLPNRYRPVSQAGPMAGQMMHTRSLSMSGALTLSQAEDMKINPTIKLVNSAKNHNNSDDDDEEEGWESMLAKRDQKKSKWRFKRRGEDTN